MLIAPSATALRLAVIYAAVFAVLGIMMPYYPVWLATRGLSTDAIGLIVGTAVAVRVVANPLAAACAERIGSVRRVAMVCAGTATITFVPMDWLWSAGPLFALSLVVYAAWSPMISLTESAAVQETRAGHIDYGRVRLWGSLTFIAATVGGGMAIDAAGGGIVHAIMLGTFAVLAVACFWLPDHRHPPSTTVWSGLISLAGDGSMRLFLIVVALSQASHAVYYGFGTLHWLALGLDETTIGLLWGWGVLAEVILFAVATRLFANASAERLMALAMAGAALRWAVMASDPTSPFVLFPLQTLHAASFGLLHLGAIRYVADRIAPERSAGAMGLVSSVGGLAVGVLLMAMGPTYAAIGGAAYGICAALSVAALAVTVTLARRPHPTTPDAALANVPPGPDANRPD